MKRRWLAYVLCGVVTIGMLVGAWAARADAVADGESNLDLLLPIAEPVMASGNTKIIIKHAGTYTSFHSNGQFLLAGQNISKRLGLPVNGDVTVEGDHLLYKSTSTDTEFGIVTNLLWIGFQDGSTELIVSSQTEGVYGGADEMRRLQRELDKKLRSLNIKPQWNVMIQGDAVAAPADPNSLLDTLSRQLLAREVERYEDNGSTSVTYYSPVIREHISNGKQSMNVQIAVHRSSVTQQKRITIGVPAISIEY